MAGLLVMNHSLTSLTLRQNEIGTEAGASIAAELEVKVSAEQEDLHAPRDVQHACQATLA